jgi:hypothetical protein
MADGNAFQQLCCIFQQFGNQVATIMMFEQNMTLLNNQRTWIVTIQIHGQVIGRGVSDQRDSARDLASLNAIQEIRKLATGI